MFKNKNPSLRTGQEGPQKHRQVFDVIGKKKPNERKFSEWIGFGQKSVFIKAKRKGCCINRDMMR